MGYHIVDQVHNQRKSVNVRIQRENQLPLRFTESGKTNMFGTKWMIGIINGYN